MNKKKNVIKERERDGLTACLAFLCVMFVLGILSKWLSWQMKPEVTVRDAEYRKLEEHAWVRGDILNGNIVPSDGGTVPPKRGIEPEITVYTKNGGLDNWRDVESASDCLVKYVWSYGETAAAAPAKCLSDRHEDSAAVSYVERTDSATSPYVIAQVSMNIHQEAGEWAALGYSLDNLVLASNKPYDDGQSVRLKTDEVLAQDGRIEVLPAKGNSFSSPYKLWMLERMLPETYTIEPDGSGNMATDGIRGIMISVKEGERYEDVMTELDALLTETGITENTRVYPFLETVRWMAFAKETRLLCLWAAVITVILICLYRDIRTYGRFIAKRCRNEYLKNVLNEELVGLLIRAIFYCAAIFVILMLARNIGGFDLDLAGRLLPPDRVLNFKYYQQSLQRWIENMSYYCKLFPTGEGADYYAVLLLEWKKTAIAAGGILAGSTAFVWADQILCRRKKKS